MSGSSSQSESSQDWLNSNCSIEKKQGEARRRQKPKIQKIPQLLLRNKSKEYYEPIVVSIGPYHHGKVKLPLMEELKTRSMKQFLGTVQNKPSFNEFKTMFIKARACYEEGSTEDFSDDDFTKMMLLDGCFILHFIYCVSNNENTNMNDQHILHVIRDLFFLENQLPFIVLEELIKLKYKTVDDGVIMIKRFIRNQFRLFSAPHHEENQTPLPMECTTTITIGEDASSQQQTGANRKAHHPLAAIPKWMIYWEKMRRGFVVGRGIRTQYRPAENQAASSRPQSTEADKPIHLLDILWIELVGKDQNESDSPTQPQNGNDSAPQQPNTFRSVEELKMAGISCKKSHTTSLKDVHFKSAYIFGHLSLPPLVVNDFSESMFLNLIAYEACPDSYVGYPVTAYLCLMDSLIDRTEDVKRLRSKGILLNLVGSDKQVAKLFNRLAKDLSGDRVYGNTASLIQKHCNTKWRTWGAEAYHTHFRSPWTITAFIAAIVIIGMTLTQTFFTVLPHK